jgi:hypothetical protein
MHDAAAALRSAVSVSKRFVTSRMMAPAGSWERQDRELDCVRLAQRRNREAITCAVARRASAHGFLPALPMPRA